MIESNYEYHCLACQRDRHAKFFMIWIDDKTKSRRCDDCQDDNVVKGRVAMRKEEAKNKPFRQGNTPLLEGLAQKPESKSKIAVRRSIEDRKMLREMGLSMEDL